jgi:hypothetical protein
MKPRTRPRRTISSMPQKAFPAFDRPLRRPQIGLVEHKVQRFLIRLVKRFGECRHETTARRATAELREIDDTGQCLTGDHPAKCRALFGRDRHIGMAAAEYHDRIAASAAVGARAQSPPHAEGIDDRYPRASIKQPLDKALRCVGLARAGGADDRDPSSASTGSAAAAGRGRLSAASANAAAARLGSERMPIFDQQPATAVFLFMFHFGSV